MRIVSFLTGVVLVVLSVLDVHGQTPGEIGQQGVLTDSLGNPISSGTFNMEFRLYSEEEGGTAVWTETQSVTVDEGVYSVGLGSVTPIELPFDAQYWLGISVDGGLELAPRLAFTAAPYARRAASVDAVSADALEDGSITTAKLADGAVDPSKINTAGTESGQVLVTNDTSGLGWGGVVQAIPNQGILTRKISAAGGATGQILTVGGDTVGWADPEEITGGALPNKSVRSVKLNSTDGEVGTVLLAAGEDSVVWGPVQTGTIADGAVTLPKLSSAGGSNGEVLVNRADSADWGLIGSSSIEVRSVNSARISTSGGANGQILTVTGDSASWRNPAGIEEGSISNDKISTVGAANGTVLTAAGGDTASWAPVTVGTANLQNNSVTPAKISGAGAQAGQVMTRTGQGQNVAWADVNPATFAAGSVGLQKLNTNGASADDLLIFNGTAPQWQANPGLPLPFFGETGANDSTSFQITNPIQFSTQNPIDNAFALHGVMSSTVGGPQATAVRGENRATSAFGIGVWGSHSGGGWGVYGSTPNGLAVYGSSLDGHAGYFDGRVTIIGTLQKSAGSFTIDHPLDPENKTLSHSFVESPDMMNIYNGTVVLDGGGSASVTLPEWFDALNRDFRYQLTPIGGPAPNLHVAQEISGNSFSIAGGPPGLKISWQVTGIRDDAYARSNPIVVEEDKSPEDRGRYLNPAAFGVSAERSTAPEQQVGINR